MNFRRATIILALFCYAGVFAWGLANDQVINKRADKEAAANFQRDYECDIVEPFNTREIRGIVHMNGSCQNYMVKAKGDGTFKVYVYTDRTPIVYAVPSRDLCTNIPGKNTNYRAAWVNEDGTCDMGR